MIWIGSPQNGAEADGEQAWQTMLKIFKRSDWEVLNVWITRFAANEPAYQLTDEQGISFFEFVERKAAAENKNDALIIARGQLATSYSKTQDYKRAAECIGFLIEQAQTPEAKASVMARLLDIYLRGGLTLKPQKVSSITACSKKTSNRIM